ncbi:9206_t:CDS:2 [Dentiscutata heterogama]|uniref:9206_t:CDS:1 n=1 Tax=Dentiscutata heterogama TaxID=1316150 RepID=A0ACA9LVF0_9GLOM|nr:9206_t:CDS:2 [Dentiscutata heterogama]
MPEKESTVTKINTKNTQMEKNSALQGKAPKCTGCEERCISKQPSEHLKFPATRGESGTRNSLRRKQAKQHPCASAVVIVAESVLANECATVLKFLGSQHGTTSNVNVLWAVLVIVYVTLHLFLALVFHAIRKRQRMKSGKKER